MADELTADALGGLIAHLLAGAVGGEEAEWRRLVGKVELVLIVHSPACNWRVTPQGSEEQKQAIQRAVELVRAEHPYVTAGDT